MRTVILKNKTGRKPVVEFKRPTVFDLEDRTPEAFDNDYDGYPELRLVEMYGFLFEDDGQEHKPVAYFRHAEKNRYRWCGFVEPGDGPLVPQTGKGHFKDVAQRDDYIIPYHKVSDDPAEFRMGTVEPYSDYHYFENHFTFEEGDFFRVTAIPFPFAIFDHATIWSGASSIIFQPTIVKGTYEGKPVIGLVEFDRAYSTVDKRANVFEGVSYIENTLLGIREDGRKESAIIHFNTGGEGNVFAYYWLEGEEPVYTDEVEADIEWHRLPYVNDGTCAFKQATFRFLGKEIHIDGKWGTKGFTEKPWVEKHGQSQIFGTWYEGKVPYKHKVYFTFCENMEAYDYKLKDMGFDVL